MKRKCSDVTKEFTPEDYNITDLSSLIAMIEDFCNLPCNKKVRRQLPHKFDKLRNILEHLYELNSMIGLHTLKNQVLDQVLFFISGTEKIMMHSVLRGPPGTGKTTVAKIMAKIYTGLGIFKKNKFRVVKREDLIGEFLGQTTLKTMECLHECKNGVMFIDEAYSLGSSTDGDSYSKEAIDCINEYLTEHSDSLICIIAGYGDELDRCFFNKNPGLKRRFPWIFTFDNFSASDLVKIMHSKIDDSLWIVEDDISSLQHIFHRNLSHFQGNGGDIDTILSMSKIINTRRCFLNNTQTLNLADIEQAINQFLDMRRSKSNDYISLMYL